MKYKHTFENGFEADVTVNVELPTEELGGLVDKIVDGAVTIIAVATVASILRKYA